MSASFDEQKKAAVPEIVVRKGHRHEAADQGLAAMHAASVPFYQRDRALVRVCLIKAKNIGGETILVPGILPVTPAVMCRALGQSAHWHTFNAKNERIRIDPPDKVVDQIMGAVDDWPFPPLAGVITCPTLRPDGSLLSSEGYDAATGLVLYKSIPIDVKPYPRRADAEAAMERLLALLAEFPFTNDESAAVALSQLMTPVLRGAFPVAPLHLTNAPEAGTGKSYLADLASAIATGERCAVIAVAPNADETEKRLIGAALAGHPIIALDNCRDALEGEFLCQVTERPLLSLRRLGVSEPIKVTNAFSVLANGNNAGVADDLVRRTLLCTLDANMESPEKREFADNPLATVLANRGAYVADVLTIARAYIVARQDGKPTPLPSYEGWSNIVRAPLMWLGIPDPIATQAALRRVDPVRQDRAAVFQAWLSDVGLNAYLASELVEFADNGTRPTFRAVLLTLAEKRGSAGQIDARRFGIWLKKHENTIAAGIKLVADRSDSYRPRWKLTTKDAGNKNAGDAGDAGVSSRFARKKSEKKSG